MATLKVGQRDQNADLSITTMFIAPNDCVQQNHLTMLARQEFQVWLNEPVPVPGTTLRSCYASQFITSYLASMAGTTLPAFSPLICPFDYWTPVTRDVGADVPYGVCCPVGYGFAQPPVIDTKRPFQGGTCYSDIISTTVTKYNDDTYSGLIFFSTAGQAYAHPLDGFLYTGQHIATSIAPGAAVTSLTPQPSSDITTTASAASSSPALRRSSAASDSVATPQLSSALSPSSTSKSRTGAGSTISSSVIPISTSGSVTLFSTGSASVVTMYISASGSQSAIASQNLPAHGSAQLSTQAIAGVVVGTVCGALLLATAIFLFVVRRKRRMSSSLREPYETSNKFDLSGHLSRPYGTSEKGHIFVAATTYHELNTPDEVAKELARGRSMQPLVGELEAQHPAFASTSIFSSSKK